MLDQKGRAKWDHWNGKKGAPRLTIRCIEACGAFRLRYGLHRAGSLLISALCMCKPSCTSHLRLAVVVLLSGLRVLRSSGRNPLDKS